MQGRNWMALAMLAPGSRMTSPTATTPLTDQKHRRAARVPVQHRRPAGRVGAGLRRPAAVQPGIDRRVPVHLQPVRRHPGPVDRRAGESDHQVGRQCVLGIVQGQFPRRSVQRAQSGAGARGADRQSAARRHAGRPDPAEPAAFLQSLWSTSASRRPASGTRRTRASTSSSRASRRSRWAACASTTRSRRRCG